ncbi:hypothetical protein ACERIT_00025 [Halopenitus sp. H-Gu1]
MKIGLTCTRCGARLERASGERELTETIGCECGALYAVTISTLR